MPYALRAGWRFLGLVIAAASFFARAEADPADNGAPAATLSLLLPPAQMPDGLPPADVVDLPPLPRLPAIRRPIAGAFSQYDGPALPGYRTVLAGQLLRDLALGPEHSPAAVRGILVVPAGRTLTLRAGAVLHLLPDPQAAAPEKPSAPDLAHVGCLWVSGRVLAEGNAERAAEISAPPGGEAALYAYPAEFSELRYVKLNRVAVTHAAGTVQWIGCEWADARHYALAGGAALFIHCRLRRCGGLLAAYDAAPWALLVTRCVFENCREGLVFRRDPGPGRLWVEHNSFVGCRGAVLRALPGPAARGATELLIGENWYGTAVPDQVDARIVDRRDDRAIRLWLNIRPPAEQPYAQIGPQAPEEVLARTLQEVEPLRARMSIVTAKAERQRPLPR